MHLAVTATSKSAPSGTSETDENDENQSFKSCGQRWNGFNSLFERVGSGKYLLYLPVADHDGGCPSLSADIISALFSSFSDQVRPG